MRIGITASIETVNAGQWNALSDGRNPFSRHEFLACLEKHGCLRSNGWHPQHVLAWDAGRLVGAMPCYLKTNSFGEFVFDWAWAEAYEQAGGQYYPKLVCAIPFTPVTGPRLLVRAGSAQPDDIKAALIRAGIALTRRLGLSSLHSLFLPEEDISTLQAQGMLRRMGCQYHWYNRGYRDFDDFLDTLRSKKRKKIKQERSTVAKAGIEISVLNGHQIDDDLWRIYYRFYCSTFLKNYTEPRLTLDFFKGLARLMPDQTLLFLARHKGKWIAGAFAMRGRNTLYGRHWGCDAYHRHLHFELCYYQTIEFTIRQGLKRLDAGAQGEHKLSRGFQPIRTWSAHWIADGGFRSAIEDFLDRESQFIDHYIHSLGDHCPYTNQNRDKA